MGVKERAEGLGEEQESSGGRVGRRGEELGKGEHRGLSVCQSVSAHVLSTDTCAKH